MMSLIAAVADVCPHEGRLLEAIELLRSCSGVHGACPGLQRIHYFSTVPRETVDADSRRDSSFSLTAYSVTKPARDQICYSNYHSTHLDETVIYRHHARRSDRSSKSSASTVEYRRPCLVVGGQAGQDEARRVHIYRIAGVQARCKLHCCWQVLPNVQVCQLADISGF